MCCLSGDGVIDKQEYRDFWHHVGGYRLASEEDIDRYFKHMTEVRIVAYDYMPVLL